MVQVGANAKLQHYIHLFPTLSSAKVLGLSNGFRRNGVTCRVFIYYLYYSKQWYNVGILNDNPSGKYFLFLLNQRLLKLKYSFYTVSHSGLHILYPRRIYEFSHSFIGCVNTNILYLNCGSDIHV